MFYKFDSFHSATLVAARRAAPYFGGGVELATLAVYLLCIVTMFLHENIMTEPLVDVNTLIKLPDQPPQASVRWSCGLTCYASPALYRRFDPGRIPFDFRLSGDSVVKSVLVVGITAIL